MSCGNWVAGSGSFSATLTSLSHPLGHPHVAIPASSKDFPGEVWLQVLRPRQPQKKQAKHFGEHAGARVQNEKQQERTVTSS